MSKTKFLQCGLNGLVLWTKTSKANHFGLLWNATYCTSTRKGGGHVLQSQGFCPRFVAKHRLFQNIQPVLLSENFITLKDPPEVEKKTLLNPDRHYEIIRKQNFGPVSLDESYVPNGHYALTSWEYSKRDFLKYDGIPYHELPIAFITAKYNNTIVDISSHDYSKKYASVSCGIAGFKNAAKKTDLAAETVGKEAAERAKLRECQDYVRVKIKGPGYGRQAALRGLSMGGLKIASITDITPLFIEGKPHRSRKVRRI